MAENKSRRWVNWAFGGEMNEGIMTVTHQEATCAAHDQITDSRCEVGWQRRDAGTPRCIVWLESGSYKMHVGVEPERQIRG